MSTKGPALKPVKPPFSWYGGKGYFVKQIKQHIPQHHLYCEVFGGSGALLFAKEKSPVEVYNDRFEQVVNFFRVLRDPTTALELQRRLQLTPFARDEHKLCKQQIDSTTDPIERARMFFVLVRQSYGSIYKDAWGYGMDHSRSTAFLKSADALMRVSQRLRDVQIDNSDFSDCIERWDAEDALFYLDPPYLPETREHNNVYQHEMTYDDHVKLLKQVKGIKGMAIISGYASDLYDSELSYWTRHEFKVRNPVAKKTKGWMAHRTEVVWVSPNVRHYLMDSILDSCADES